MKPRILILTESGGFSESFDLKDSKSLTIGRESLNGLVLSGIGISRHHSRITRTNTGDFNIEDLDSHNGTFVNDIPVRQFQLKHGDRIRIGRTRLLFLTLDDDKAAYFSNEVKFVEDGVANTESDVLFLAVESGKQVSADLTILTKIGKVLSEVESSEELQQNLIEIILEIIPAERAAIMLLSNDLTSPHSITVLNKKCLDGNQAMKISRRISNFVFNKQTAVLSNNISQTEFEGAESLISYGIHSVLCVPLLLGEITGLIYLDSSDGEFKFEDNHLQQMTAIANVAAAALKNVRYLEALKTENESLQNLMQIETNMIGESQPMKSLYNLVAKASPSDSTILISGESGTGKELVARAIHKNSLRRNKPFVAVNCALLNENLLESDLFGHEKGSFTGAVVQRKGKIQLAEEGTLFLDEIGELSLHLQAKLLRFLQEREFERVGGTKLINADVRIIAATNRDLKAEIKSGRFREDLFFRLKVVEIQMPALRERKEDIPLLTQHFIKKYSERCKRRIEGITRKATAALVNYEWCGNVRELENVIERAIVLGTSGIIQLEDLPYEIIEKRVNENDSNLDFHGQVTEAKRKIVLSAIKDTNKNYSEAARRLGMHPNNLHRVMRELDIKDKAKK